MTRLNIKLALVMLFLASTLVEQAMPFVFKVKSSSSYAAITLTIKPTTLDNGVAELEWNSTVPNVTYTIERSDGIITTIIVRDISVTKYNDTIVGICQDTQLTYIVKSSISETSNPVSAVLKDTKGPIEPQVNSVTITSNGGVEIRWDASISSDVSTYQAYRKEGNTFLQYASVSGLFFQDNPGGNNFINPCENIVTYVILAVDGCDNSSSGATPGIIGNYLTPLNTILLEKETASSCDKKVNLKWNAYNNAMPALTEYRVEESVDGAAFSTIATIPPSSPLQHTIEDHEVGKEYQYRITATNNSIYSQSCVVTFTPSYTIPEIVINNVTVKEDSYVSVSYSIKDPASDGKIVVYRGIDEGELTEYMEVDGTGSFDDMDVDVDNQKYTYQIIAYDACGNKLSESNKLGTIVLTLVVLEDYKNIGLTINSDYTNHTFLRFNDAVSTIISTGSTATDNIGLNNSLNTYYVVEVNNADGTVSRSNSVQLPSRIKTPTAFRPGGKFPLFKPYLQNIKSTYLFIIYNRWGQELFRTTNPEVGWKGENSQPGAYAYRISYIDANGKKQTQLGWFIVIK